MRQIESTVEAWANRIRPHLHQVVERIVAAGRELIAAKGALPHGRFGPLLNELGLSRQMANRFMRVAAHPAIATRPPVGSLPTAVSVLDVLARLDEDELNQAIEAGDITPSTTRVDALALVRRDHVPPDEHERRLERAVREARASGDPVALYRALDEHAMYLELMAAAWRLRAEVVALFRKYEGMSTDAGDTVTVETFAEHIDIPIETFRHWLEAVES